MNHPRFALDPSAIVSGSDHESDAEEDVSDTSQEDDSSLSTDHGSTSTQDKNDYLYDPNLDEEDEAWVYKHMRGGIQENMTVRLDKKDSTSERVILPVYQPRKSDAVLSCPCCFQIVCMDCQRHEIYMNQYRAMFVMNIGVAWDQIIVPEHEAKSKNIVREEEDDNDETNEIYYSVYCNACRTQVAALNMQDEVYHFFGCLASSA